MKYFNRFSTFFLHFFFALDTFEDLEYGMGTSEKNANLPKMLCFDIP